MPKVKNVEKRIWDIEGFEVVIKSNGKNLRGDKQVFKQYEGGRAARNSWTIAEWKKKRFSPQYQGFDVDILDGDGNPVDGRTTLGTVRDSYDEDEE